MIRALCIAALLALPANLWAAAPPATDAAVEAAPPTPPAPVYRTVDVRLETSKGTILLRLERDRAPLTTANFLRYVDAKKLDGIEFFRAVTFPERPDLGLIQAGLHDPRLLFPAIAHESTARTGLTHNDGAISMARGTPGSAQADFFIIVGGLPGLDADPAATGDNQGYAVFGHVVDGMDVVRAILQQPTDPQAGAGLMRGQMLASPVVIRTARRAPQ